MGPRDGQRKKVCVVGAGMSGLVSAKTLLESEFDVTIFEKRHTLGGIWSPGAQYYSVTTQVGDGGYEFLDMTNPGDLISRSQIQDYQFRYAKTFGVLPCCNFGVEVMSVQHDGREWNVSTTSSDGQQVHKFEFMIVSTGIYSNPKIPHWSDLPGGAEFTGEIIHCTNLQHAEQLSGKRVLIIGGGKSSIDCTCTAAEAGAKKIHHVSSYILFFSTAKVCWFQNVFPPVFSKLLVNAGVAKQTNNGLQPRCLPIDNRC